MRTGPVRLTLDEAPGWVADRLRGRAGTRWVGVDGLGASGKTTLAGRIAAAVGGVVVGTDDFSEPGARTWAQDRFVAEVLEPLRVDRRGRYRRWPPGAPEPGGWAEVRVGVPVVVEGVSSTDVRLPVPWDVTLWVEVPYEVRLARVRARDGEAQLERWRTDWWPSEEAYEAAQRPQKRVNAIVVA